MKKLALSLMTMGLLAACSSTPVTPVGFNPPPSINLNVQTVSLMDNSVPSSRESSDGVNIQPTVQGAIQIWAKDHLTATGHDGDALLSIKDASFTVQPILLEHGFMSWFKRQQATKYIAHASVELTARSSNETVLASAEASRWASLPEDPTEDEKRIVYFSVINGLMHDLEKNLDISVQEHMPQFIGGAPASVSFGK